MVVTDKLSAGAFWMYSLKYTLWTTGQCCADTAQTVVVVM
jgi:hypothetical protein